MNFLIISPEYPPFCVGGVGVHVDQLVQRMCINNNVTVISFSHNDRDDNCMQEDVADTLKIFRVSLPAKIYEKDLEQLYIYQNQLIKNRLYSINNRGILDNIDLIIVHGYFLADAAIYAKELLEVPLIYHAHTVFGLMNTSKKINIINNSEKILCNIASAIIAVSKYLKEQLMSAYRIESSKIHVISKGVDIQSYDTISAEPFKLYFRILFVGRISKEKGIETLLLALKYLQKRVTQRIVLFVAGTASEYSYLIYIKKMIKKLNLQEYVVFLGFVQQKNLIYEYKISNIVVVPSFEETFGRVAIEAMAAKRTVIVSDIGGLGPIIKHGYTGLKFDAGNYKKLADNIYSVISDCKTANELALKGYEEVCNKYSIEKIYEQTIHVYKKFYNEGEQK